MEGGTCWNFIINRQRFAHDFILSVSVSVSVSQPGIPDINELVLFLSEVSCLGFLLVVAVVVIEYQVPMHGHQFATLASVFILVRDLPVVSHAVTIAVTRSRTVTVTVTAVRRLAVLAREAHQLVNGLLDATMTTTTTTAAAAAVPSSTAAAGTMQHLVDGVRVMVRLHLDGHMNDQTAAGDATCLQQSCG